MENRRTFVAAGLPEDVKKYLVGVQTEMSSVDQGIKWVRPELMHVTLKFLGKTPERIFPEIEKELEQIMDGREAMSLELSGVGRFPRQGYPKVLWAGMNKIPKEMYALSDELNTAFLSMGFDDTGKRFLPHITLGRVKSKIDEDFLAQFHQLNIFSMKFNIDRIIWYESIHRNGILTYDPIRTFYL